VTGLAADVFKLSYKAVPGSYLAAIRSIFS